MALPAPAGVAVAPAFVGGLIAPVGRAVLSLLRQRRPTSGDILQPYEVGYRVAPAYDSQGLVGAVSEETILPYDCYADSYGANLPSIPHQPDSFTAYLYHYDTLPGKYIGGWRFLVWSETYRSPRYGWGTTLNGEPKQVRAWDRVYLIPHDNMPDVQRGLRWNNLDDYTFTVGQVVTAKQEGFGDRQAETFGFWFTINEWEKLKRIMAGGKLVDPVQAEGGGYSIAPRAFTVMRAELDASGKLFPRDGYRLRWPWSNAADGPHRDADRWVVYKRQHDAWGFIGTTDTAVGSGSAREAVFEDRGIPPDLALPPPIRRPEGAASVATAQSARRGEHGRWPGVGGRFAQRTVLGGYLDFPTQLKFSSPGELLDFRISTPTRDTDSFIRELNASGGAEVRHVLESSGLLVFTSGGEWAVGAAGAFTPSSAQAQAVGYVGASHVAPIPVDDRVMFVNRPGTRVYTVSQEQELGKLDVNELTTLAHTIFENDGIRSMAWSADERMLLVALEDSFVCVTFIPESNVIAFSTHQPAQAEDRAEPAMQPPPSTDLACGGGAATGGGTGGGGGGTGGGTGGGGGGLSPAAAPQAPASLIGSVIPAIPEPTEEFACPSTSGWVHVDTAQNTFPDALPDRGYDNPVPFVTRRALAGVRDAEIGVESRSADGTSIIVAAFPWWVVLESDAPVPRLPWNEPWRRTRGDIASRYHFYIRRHRFSRGGAHPWENLYGALFSDYPTGYGAGGFDAYSRGALRGSPDRDSLHGIDVSPLTRAPGDPALPVGADTRLGVRIAKTKEALADADFTYFLGRTLFDAEDAPDFRALRPRAEDLLSNEGRWLVTDESGLFALQLRKVESLSLSSRNTPESDVFLQAQVLLTRDPRPDVFYTTPEALRDRWWTVRNQGASDFNLATAPNEDFEPLTRYITRAACFVEYKVECVHPGGG